MQNLKNSLCTRYSIDPWPQRPGPRLRPCNWRPGRRPTPAQADIEKPRCRAPPAALAEAGGKLSTCVATSLAPLGFSKGRVVKGQNVSRSEYKHWASPGPAIVRQQVDTIKPITVLPYIEPPALHSDSSQAMRRVHHDCARTVPVHSVYHALRVRPHDCPKTSQGMAICRASFREPRAAGPALQNLNPNIGSTRTSLYSQICCGIKTII